MEFTKVVSSRKSVRDYSSKPVEPKKIKKILEIPDNIKVVGMTPVGYSKEKEEFRSKISKKIIDSNKRRAFEQIVHKEKW